MAAITRTLNVFFFGVISCSIEKGGAHASGQKIRLGLFAPITLPTGGNKINLIGSQYVASFYLAVQEINAILVGKNVSVLATVRDGVGMTPNTFTNGVKQAIDYAQTSYGGKGCHGVVGGMLNYPTLALGYILKEANIAQVAYGSDASDLSHNDVFPDFSRTYPSASYQGHAIADMIGNHFKWERVVVAYSTDLYGTDALAEFKTAAALYGVNIIFLLPITPGQDLTNFDSHIQQALTHRPRIFALFISSPLQAAQLLQQSYLAGLMNVDSFVIGTSALSTSAIWTSIPNQAIASQIMSTIGYFGLAPADKDWKVTDKGKDFITRYRQQASTVTVLPSGTRVCNNTLSNTVDDDGRYYKYKIMTATKYSCTGFNFSSFKADGSDIADISAQVYDATMALVYGILNATVQADGSYKIPDYISGLKVKSELVSKVAFEVSVARFIYIIPFIVVISLTPYFGNAFPSN
jgi:ABC-type branched-subunit amino acid transport system substrate-binding protein